jgi:hypothetical protein
LINELESEEDELSIKKPIVNKVLKLIKTLQKEGNAKTIDQIVKNIETKAENEKKKLK